MPNDTLLSNSPNPPLQTQREPHSLKADQTAKISRAAWPSCAIGSLEAMTAPTVPTVPVMQIGVLLRPPHLRLSVAGM
jgi:hypothetical protein